MESEIEMVGIMEKIAQLINRIGNSLIDAEVYVTAIEKVEDYDAWFFSLQIEREKFKLEEIEEIRRIIAKMNFVERDVSISSVNGKVKLFFDLRW